LLIKKKRTQFYDLNRPLQRLETEAKHQIPIAPRGIPLSLGQKFWRRGTVLKSIVSGSN
jgi:hypothetical protein